MSTIELTQEDKDWLINQMIARFPSRKISWLILDKSRTGKSLNLVFLASDRNGEVENVSNYTRALPLPADTFASTKNILKSVSAGNRISLANILGNKVDFERSTVSLVVKDGKTGINQILTQLQKLGFETMEVI